MAGPKPIKEVQDAKAKLAKRCAGRGWSRGIGVAPAERKDRFKLRLTVDPSAKDDADVPTEYEGIPVEVVFLSAYKPRGSVKGGA
jgi:hypothetical protein